MVNTNTSATGGFLAPVSLPPAYDVDLAVQVQQTVAGITGLDIGLVRPRWQPIPPEQPPRTTNWCALGATLNSADVNPTIVHCGEGDGTDTLYRGEEWVILISFYGPACNGYAALMRDGFGIEQNRYAMLDLGLAFVATDRITRAPDIVNTEAIDRVDVSIRVRRRVSRTYAVNNILSASGELTTDGSSADGSPIAITPFQVQE